MSQKHVFNVNFFVKRSKALSNGKLPIYIRIALNSQRTEIGTGRSIETIKWDAFLRNPNINKQLNKYLEAIRFNLRNIFIEYLEKGDDFNINSIKNTFLGKGQEVNNLLAIHREYNETVTQLVGHDYVKSTAIHYKTSLK